jgi:hypothetical protein
MFKNTRVQYSVIFHLKLKYQIVIESSVTSYDWYSRLCLMWSLCAWAYLITKTEWILFGWLNVDQCFPNCLLMRTMKYEKKNLTDHKIFLSSSADHNIENLLATAILFIINWIKILYFWKKFVKKIFLGTKLETLMDQ